MRLMAGVILKILIKLMIYGRMQTFMRGAEMMFFRFFDKLFRICFKYQEFEGVFIFGNQVDGLPGASRNAEEV